MKVLVVDDNMLIRKVVCATLEEEGMECSEAAQGADAIRQCLEDPPEVVLLDFNLPDIDGLEILSTLKSQDRTRSIRAFLLTGSSDIDIGRRALEAGAEACLAKPLRASDLAARLRKH